MRPEFVDYWAYKWSDLLLVNSEKLKPAAMWGYHNWIRNQVANNTPWDVLVHSIVTATGSTLENGAANFFVLHQDPADLAETTSLAFLGMSINCAKCHNHPLEKWTNDQYYGMANLFARVRIQGPAGRRQPHGLSGAARRPGAAAHRQAAAPLPAGRHAAGAGRHDRSPRASGRAGSPRRRIPISAGRSPTACGRIFSAWAWWKTSTICGSPIRPATSPCWPRRPAIWSTASTI